MSSTTKHTACPDCGPKNKPLSTTTDNRGSVSYCHRCGYTEANNTATGGTYSADPRAYRAWRDIAEALWMYSRPLAGTVAETYLMRRKCRLPPDDGDLRFLPARRDFPAAMLGRVTDAITAEPISLHFTGLNPDGTKAGETPKRLLVRIPDHVDR